MDVKCLQSRTVVAMCKETTLGFTVLSQNWTLTHLYLTTNPSELTCLNNKLLIILGPIFTYIYRQDNST